MNNKNNKQQQHRQQKSSIGISIDIDSSIDSGIGINSGIGSSISSWFSLAPFPTKTSSNNLLCSLAQKSPVLFLPFLPGSEQSLYFQVYLIRITLGVSSKENFVSTLNQPIPSQFKLLQGSEDFTVFYYGVSCFCQNKHFLQLFHCFFLLQYQSTTKF